VTRAKPATGVVGGDVDLMVSEGTERCDKEGGDIVKVLDLRDDAKGVVVDVLVLRTPDLLTTFINNCIQMWVSVCHFGARRLIEEVWEKGVVDEVVVISGRRLYGGSSVGGWVTERWGWAPNDVFG